MDLGYVAIRTPRGHSSLDYLSPDRRSQPEEFHFVRIAVGVLPDGKSGAWSRLSISTSLDLFSIEFPESRAAWSARVGRLPGSSCLSSVDHSQCRPIPTLHSNSLGFSVRTLDGEQSDLRPALPAVESHHAL